MGHDTNVYLMVGVPADKLVTLKQEKRYRKVFDRYTGQPSEESFTIESYVMLGREYACDHDYPSRIKEHLSSNGMELEGLPGHAVVGQVLSEWSERAYVNGVLDVSADLKAVKALTLQVKNSLKDAGFTGEYEIGVHIVIEQST